MDFSGAKTANGTWVINGNLTEEKLLITGVIPQPEKDPLIRIERLAQRIRENPNSLWAFDFPFSLPEEFAKRIIPEYCNSWFLLAQAFESITLREFEKKADDYCRQYEEPRRYTDKQSKGAFSALHKVHPNMRPMTYYGIRLLAKLISSQAPVKIPPLHQCSEEGFITIVEIHPRSTLLNIFDRQEHRWGYKKRANCLQRKNILERLEQNRQLPVTINKEQREILLDSHDALDSLVACWTGALWLEKPKLYDYPLDRAELELEGWIWAPKSNLFKPSS